MADLPEYLTEQTEEAIRQRMLDRLPADLDKSEGSFAWDVMSPVAIELALAAIWAQEVLRRGFAQTTFGRYLDLRAEEYGITRRPAVAATVTLRFTGAPGTVIPAGTRVSTVSTQTVPAVLFETTQAATIPAGGSVDVPAVAVQPGAAGNVAAGTLTMLASPLPGVTSVTNPSAAAGGIDEEDDDTLRARLLERARRDEGDGSVADYIRWAREVPGVGQVYVEPLWQGPGTVRVVILDQNGDIPPADLVNAVQEHLDPGGHGVGLGRAPIGARVTVQGPRDVPLTVTIPGLQVEPGYDAAAVKAAIEAAVRAYIVAVSPGLTIRLKDVEAAVANTPGVLDFGDVTINGARQNVDLDVDEKGALAAVIYT